MMFLLAGFVLGSTLLLSFMDNLARQDSWIVIIAAFVCCIPFVLSVAFLVKRFPGMSFIDILCAIYGRVIGSAVFLSYIGYVFIILAFNLRDIADFYIGFVLPEMPMPALLIVIMLVSAYGVHKGILSIAKIGFLSLVYAVVTILLTFALLIKDMDFTNFLPVLEIQGQTFVKGTHVMTAVPYCEVFVLMMLAPSLSSTKKLGGTALGGVGIAAFCFLAITVRNIAVLGPSTAIYAGNSYQAARMINISESLTRVELITAIGITISLFVKISVLFYAAANGTSQLLRLRSPSPLILPLGALAVVLAMIAFESTVSHTADASRYHPFFPFPFAIILPPLTLLVAAIRGLPKQKETGGS